MAYSEKKQGKLHKISDKRPPWKPRTDYAIGCGCTDNSELLKEIKGDTKTINDRLEKGAPSETLKGE